MSVAQQEPAPTSEPGSDRAVVEAVRAGEISQFALLYERYSREAMGIARRQVGADEAQDLVQETFAKVLRAIQNGGGPTEDVAGYIFRTLRNLRIDRGGQREFATEDVESAGPAGLWVVPDTSDEVLDRGLVSDAFAELPPRWREVLWLTEVEGVGPGELSDRMGIKATAISTLSLRARAGFRSAWLQAHVRAGSAPRECRPVVTRLGDYQTGRLSSRRRAQVESHLDECDHCPAVIAELSAVSGHMGTLLLPVVVLAPKALWWVFGGWGVKAGFLLWGTKATLNRIRDPKVAASSVGGAATVAVVTAVAMAMTAPPDPPPAADPAPSASAPGPSSTGQGSSSTSSPSSSDQSEPEDADQTADADEPADSPASVPAAPVDPEVATPDQSAAESAAQESPAPTPDEPSGPTPQEPEPTSQPGEPAQEPSAEPTDPEPERTPPEQLVLSVDQASGSVEGPTLELTGTGAVPGATITATDEDGEQVADDTVADDGTWALAIAEPDAGGAGGGMPGPAASGGVAKGVAARGLAGVVAERGDDRTDGDDDGSVGEAHYFTLTQTVPEGVSDDYVGESEPLRVGPYTWVDSEPEPEPEPAAPPTIVCPDDGDEVRLYGAGNGTGWITVRIEADTEFDVQFLIDGEPAAMERWWALFECGWLGERWGRDVWRIRGVDQGEHELTVRYLDDQGEPVGDSATVRFIAEPHGPDDDHDDDGREDDDGDDRHDGSDSHASHDEYNRPDPGSATTGN